MPDLVRVRTKTGIETNVSQVIAQTSEDLTVLDEPAQVAFGRARTATRKDGRPLLPTTSVDAEATKKADSSASSKETAK